MKEEVYRILREIPYGKVMTYGQIAKRLGNPHLARAVGNILHQNPDGVKNPCFKVVNSEGKPSEHYAFGGIGRQIALLQSEGIEVENGRVDLKKYGVL